MIINEKSLIANVKKAYKDSGYRVVCKDRGGEEWISIIGNTFIANMTVASLPRKVLGLIAEHAGRLPEKDTCLKLSKDDVQTAMIDSVPTIQELFDDNSHKETVPTNLTWKGHEVWQCPEIKRCFLLNPELRNMITLNGKCVQKTDGRSVVVYDSVSEIYILNTSEDEDDAHVLRHLEKWSWN